MISLDLETPSEELVVCGICGGNHACKDCTTLQVSYYVHDKQIPSRARLSLPDIFEIITLADGTYEVAAKVLVEKGTQFGPLQAQNLFTLKPCINFPLKIFLTTDEHFKEYYLDTSNENECNWLMFVNSACNVEEQNLICYQDQDKIYYSSIKDIQKGEYLKVWYSAQYAVKMNQKLLDHDETCEIDTETEDITLLVETQQKIVSRDIWNCKFCGRIEKNVVLFANHLLEHYSTQLRKICEYCKRVFGSGKLLKKHVSIVHGNKLMNQVNENLKTAVKVKNIEPKETSIGGPLLNHILSDSLDNSNFLLQQIDFNQFSINNTENQGLVLENDNLSVDNLNLKSLDHFNFELNDSDEQIICDICLKPFVKIRSLIQHMKQHTGQYYCKQCNKIFCRKENMLAHACLKFPNEQCTICHKKFLQKKYVNQHMVAVHGGKFQCRNCENRYSTKSDLTSHNCTKIPTEAKKKYTCTVCQKVFSREKYMKQHLARHQQLNVKPAEKIICEFCCSIFSSSRAYRHHMVLHRDPKHKCEVCGKMYHKQDLLKNHMIRHSTSELNVNCPICNKSIKSKRFLTNHLKTHKEEKNHQCSLCNCVFKFRSSYLKHLKSKHKDAQIDELGKHDCPKCSKKFKFKPSLYKHIKQHHPEYYPQATAEKLPNNNRETMADIDKNQLNIIEAVENMDFSNIATSNDAADLSFEDMLNNTSNIDLLTNTDKIVETLLGISPAPSGVVPSERSDMDTREICLSMPDLSETDQEIHLGENAYILENGNIVEPQEKPGNVVMYVLGSKFP